ncbi:MAG: hypothetical protein ACLRVT_02290 [Oscillospiraceae bacterium]
MRLLSAMAATVVLAAGILTSCQKSNEISLKDLKTEGEYQYAKAMWNTSAQEVEKSLPFSMEKHPIVPEGNTGKYYVPYRSENITVDGLKATAKWEFYEDQLKYIQFVFEIPEDGCQEQFDKEVERLTQQFGSESEKKEYPETGTQAYLWETDHTRLMITLSTGGTQNPYGSPTMFLSISHLSLLEDKYRDMPHQ